MNKNKKYILIALLASLLFTVTIGFSVWIILSEQVRGHVQKMGEISFAPTLNSPTATYYAGEAAPFSYDPVIYSYYYNGESTPKQWEITGTAEINTLVGKGGSLTDGALDTECVITFRPTSPLAQWLWGETITATVTVKLLPVAQNGDVYYTTVDKALEGIQNASSGTVYVIPSGDYTNIEDPETGRARFAKTITPVYDKEGKEVPREIPAGVTLCIPYDVSMTLLTPYLTVETNGGVNSSFINAYTDHSKYCTNIVTLNASLVCKGSLEVCGLYNAGKNGQVSGQVFGNFGLLKVGDSGALSVEGSAVVFGFIEGTGDCEKIVFQNNSSLLQPFVIYEFRGGTNTVYMLESTTQLDVSLSNLTANLGTGYVFCMPFYRYTMPNIVGGFRLCQTASFEGYLTLHMDGANYPNTLPFIGGTDGHLVEMTSSDSFVDVFYDPNLIDGMYGRTTWSLDGDASVNSLAIPISLQKSGVTVKVSLTTDSIYLPISYLLEIRMQNGKVDFGTQDVKLLPGAQIVIGDNAEVTMQRLISYTDPPPTAADKNIASSVRFYPSGDELKDLKLPETGSCKIESGGKLTIKTAVRGEIVASGSGGILSVLSNEADDAEKLESLEFYAPNGSDVTGVENIVEKTGGVSVTIISVKDTCYYLDVDMSAIPFFVDALSDSVDTYNANTTYYSGEKDGKYAWYSPDMTVTFMANGVAAKTVEPDSSYDGLVTPPTVTRDYYTFSHWCTSDGCTAGDSCTNKINFATQKFFTTTTLYAAWKANTYTVNYVYVLPDDTLVDECGVDSVENVTPTTTVTLPTIASLSKPMDENGQTYICTGLYTAKSGGTKLGTTLSISQYPELASVNNGTATVYIRWQARSYNVSFVPFEVDKTYYSDVSIPTQTDVDADYDPLADQDVNDIITKHDGNSNTDQYYFAGWYLDASYANEYKNNLNPSDDANLKDVTLYAKWETKATVTFADGTNAPATYVKDGTPLYIKPGTTIALKDYFNDPTALDSDVSVSRYYGGWSTTVGAISGSDMSATYTVSESTTISTVWYLKHHITVSISGATNPSAKITINGTLALQTATTNTTGVWAKPGDSVNIYAYGKGSWGWGWSNCRINVTGFTEVADAYNNPGATFDNTITATKEGATSVVITKD